MNRVTIVYFLVLVLFGVFLIAITIRLLCSLPGASCTIAL
jgi:hypothetical protein